MDYNISEIIQVKVNGTWYDAEILDISESSAFVYIFDLGTKKNIASRNMRWAGTR